MLSFINPDANRIRKGYLIPGEIFFTNEPFMKLLSIFLILVFAPLVFGQPEQPSVYKGSVRTVGGSIGGNFRRYANREHGFSFLPPENSNKDDNNAGETNGLVTFSCSLSNCGVTGTFTVSKVVALDSSIAEPVKFLQQKSTHAEFSKFFVSSAKPEDNPAVLSIRYFEIGGRPALKLDYNLTTKGQSFNGSMIELYADEKKSLVVFNYLSADSDAPRWSKRSEAAISSFKILSDADLPGVSLDALRTGDVSGTKNDSYYDSVAAKNVLNGYAVILHRPAYPPAAKAVRASGAVQVQVTINEDGKVISATAVSGHPLLHPAAIKSAYLSEFRPTELSGERVKVTGIIVYNFVP